MGRISRLACLLGAAGTGLACSLTADLSGFSGGENGAADSGGADVTTDGSSGSDATNDGPPATVLPNKSFSCADHTTATFCADFNSPPVNAGWTGMEVCNSGCSATLDTTTSVSPPSSFHSMKPAHLSGNPFASLYKELDRFSTAHFEVDIRFNKLAEAGSDLTVFYFCFHDNTRGCGGLGGFGLELTQTGLKIETDELVADASDHKYQSFFFKAPTLPKLEEWAHFTFELTLEATKSTLVVKMDGVEKIGKPIDLSFHTWANSEKVLPAFNVGLFYIYPTVEQHVWFDNVLVEAK